MGIATEIPAAVVMSACEIPGQHFWIADALHRDDGEHLYHADHCAEQTSAE